MSRERVGSVRQVRPHVWRIEIESGHDPVTGRRRRLSRTVTGERRDAEREKSRMLLEIGRVPTAGMTLAAYLEDVYLPAVHDTVRRRTYEGYRAKLDLYVLPALGSVRLADLAPYTLDRWIATLGHSPRTRLHAYRILHAALGRAVRWRLIEANPLDAVEPPRVERQRPDTLTAAEASAYLEAFRGHALEPVVVLGLSAGLRRSELAGLTWRDLDLSRGAVRVERGMHESAGEVWCEPPKSATSRRSVALPAWACDRLRDLRGIGPLVAEDGAPMRPSRISALYGRHARACGLRVLPLKQLRHTSACLLIEAGVDLYTVSRRLGHSGVQVTQDHYVKPGEMADRQAAAALDGLGGEVRGTASRRGSAG